MKKFSKSWISSKDRRKQRKFRYNAPKHIRRKLLSAHLSKELREKYKRRAFPLRKGDVVKILRGKFKGVEGKVIKVDYKNYKIMVENAIIKKNDGKISNYPIDPSNVMLVDINLEDKKREEALKRKLEK